MKQIAKRITFHELLRQPAIDTAALSTFIRDTIRDDSSGPDAPVQPAAPRGE